MHLSGADAVDGRRGATTPGFIYWERNPFEYRQEGDEKFLRRLWRELYGGDEPVAES